MSKLKLYKKRKLAFKNQNPEHK